MVSLNVRNMRAYQESSAHLQEDIIYSGKIPRKKEVNTLLRVVIENLKLKRQWKSGCSQLGPFTILIHLLFKLLTTALSFPSLHRQTGQQGETPEQVNYNNKGEEN